MRGDNGWEVHISCNEEDIMKCVKNIMGIGRRYNFLYYVMCNYLFLGESK